MKKGCNAVRVCSPLFFLIVATTLLMYTCTSDTPESTSHSNTNHSNTINTMLSEREHTLPLLPRQRERFQMREKARRRMYNELTNVWTFSFEYEVGKDVTHPASNTWEWR